MKYLFLFIGLVAQISIYAQEIIFKPKYLKYEMSDTTKQNVLSALEGLYVQLIEDKLDLQYIHPDQQELTLSTLETFEDYEQKMKLKGEKQQDKQLINIYPIEKNKYWLTISYQRKNDGESYLLYILNLVAEESKGQVRFSIPINYLTKYWQTKQVGNIKYHYRDSIQLNRAKIFDQKNTLIANKLGLIPEKMDFYMCDNRQEILKLQGLDYHINLNGKVQDGYGVDAHTIFAIQNNEDFSHDMVHYYSGKTNDHANRNWITEEGVAYYWGNAYYTNREREMIEFDQLVGELNTYLITHPDSSIYKMFNEDPKIFNNLSTEISVRSTISGIIVYQVEKLHGVDGVLELVNCGRKDRMDKYLKTIEKLLNVTQENFDGKLALWIQEYLSQ
jgi:hypothetical protein